MTSAAEAVRLVLAGDDCDPAEYQLTFAVDGNRLTPSVVSTMPASESDLTRAFFERDWTRIADVED